MESTYAATLWKLDFIIDYFGSREAPKEDRVFVSPDLCQYGMGEPGAEEVYWKKANLHSRHLPGADAFGNPVQQSERCSRA